MKTSASGTNMEILLNETKASLSPLALTDMRAVGRVGELTTGAVIQQ
jgi:hypothetical protein